MIIAETGSMSYWRKGTGQVIYFLKNVPFFPPTPKVPPYATMETPLNIVVVILRHFFDNGGQAGGANTGKGKK
jgi:hypothetical protein